MERVADTQGLLDEIQNLKDQLDVRDKTLAEKDAVIGQLTEELKLARHRQFGRKSEKLIAQQRFAFDEMSHGVADTPSKETIVVDVPAHVRKIRKGRKPLPSHLERRDIIHDLDDAEKVCSCGCQMVKIGQEESEKLAIIPRQVYVQRHIRVKYRCSQCASDEKPAKIHIATVEPSIIPRSIATPQLLTTIFLGKFEDHLPYYRQEKQFERQGIEISRQDMSNWTIQTARFLEPLINLMGDRLKSYPVINMDETSVQVLGEVGKENTSLSYMWLARGGPPGQSVVLYTYNQRRSSAVVRTIIGQYEGYLQTDGFSGYDSAQKESNFTLVGCWAHVRRKFDEAAKVAKKAPSAREALSQIARLYAIEKTLRQMLSSGEMTANEFTSRRKQQCQPIIDKFHAWLMRKSERILPSSAAGKAVAYAVKQWPKLIRYLEHADLTPDNNSAERAIRPFVLGRKNWMFSGSPVGAMASNTLYSLIQSAKENGLNTRDYLNFVFSQAPKTHSSNWEKFLPFQSI